MTQKKSKTTAVEAVEARDVTAVQIAQELQMNAKSLRRILRAETRDETTETMHKKISHATRYAFTRSEADAIVARVKSKRSA